MASIKHTIQNLATSRFDKKQAALVQRIIGSTSIALLDVGAAHGAHIRWTRFKKYIDYFAVEPDSRSAASVFQSKNAAEYKSETLITKALWHSEGEITLNLCRKPMVSSVYEPNRLFIDLFLEPERFDIVDRIKLSCVTVDRVGQQVNTNFDVIKLDVQGAELDVLRGATTTIQRVLAIDIEVEFCELYEKQPLFDEIFSFLRNYNLELIDFSYIYRWSPDSYNGLGQATFSDALFMQSPERIGASNDIESVRKYAIICAIYERGDLLLRLRRACACVSEEMSVLCEDLTSLGNLLSARNARTQRQLDRVTKIISLFHPRVRAHILH